jgi:solute:Na+ symporter, SSS family
VPLSVLGLRQFGGFAHLLSSLPSGRGHLWQTLPFFAPQATMDRFGLIVGLGLVLSFGYWSTDFVQMQRALAVRRMQDVPYVPLAQAFAKLIFAFLIVVPGVIAPLVLPARGQANWNATLPSMMQHYYSPSWIVIGFMGLTATLVSTFANNVSGFTSVWVQGVYRPWIRPGAGEGHYLGISRMTNAAAVLLSVGAAYVALTYHSLMEYMQMIFSTFNAPLLALVALAALTPRRAAQGGVGGFTIGLASTVLHQAFVRAGLLHYGSPMNANFYTAILGFCIAAAGTLLIGVVREQPASAQAMGVQPVRLPLRFSKPTILLAAGIAALCVALNVLFW